MATLALFFFLVLHPCVSYGSKRSRGNKRSKTGTPNVPNGFANERQCKLTDKSSGAVFDLSALHKANIIDKKFYVIYGAAGGPFDHVDVSYDYHFTLCGADPPTPLSCLGTPDIFRAAAYQIARKKRDEGEEWRVGEDEGDIQNCVAIGSGDRADWTFSLIDKDDPSAGVQIDYTNGQECMKRTVVKKKTETGREKRVVEWVSTPRSTTIKMVCNPDARADGERKDKAGNTGRLAGSTQTVHAREDEMCHYTLEWESPHGCPINKPIRSRAAQRDDDLVVTSDASGFHMQSRREASRGGFFGFLFRVFWICFWGAGALAAVQVYRHWRWMKVLVPQMAHKNRLQQKLARKKFFKLMTTFDNTSAKRAVPARSLV